MPPPPLLPAWRKEWMSKRANEIETETARPSETSPDRDVEYEIWNLTSTWRCEIKWCDVLFPCEILFFDWHGTYLSAPLKKKGPMLGIEHDFSTLSSPGTRSCSVDESAKHHQSTLQVDETREAVSMRTSPPRQNTSTFTTHTYTHSYIHTYLPSLYSDLAQSPNSGSPFFFSFFDMSKTPHKPHP